MVVICCRTMWADVLPERGKAKELVKDLAQQILSNQYFPPTQCSLSSEGRLVENVLYWYIYVYIYIYVFIYTSVKVTFFDLVIYTSTSGQSATWCGRSGGVVAQSKL